MSEEEAIFPTHGEMSRQHRILIGSTIYGLYLLGMATTECERTDEDCAMDNMGVPRRYEDIKPRYRDQIVQIHGMVTRSEKVLKDVLGGTKESDA